MKRGMTSTPSRPSAARCIAAMASGLLSSIPITPRFTPRARIAALSPSTMRSDSSIMRRWSHVTWVSHSAPLRIMVSQYLPSPTVSFTWVGKVAPPMPQMPAACTAGTILVGSHSSTPPSGSSSVHSSWKSFLMVMMVVGPPSRSTLVPMAVTSPETLA